jgi:hypothetical protein
MQFVKTAPRSLFPLNASGIVPSGPTAADLGLDTNPNRGPGDMESIFFMGQGAPEKALLPA